MHLVDRVNILVPPLTTLLTALVLACAPGEQSLEAKDPKDVQLMRTAPPAVCRELSALVADAPSGTDAERSAKASLREKAARLGANYVRWETLEISEDPPRATIHGTAYLCPSAGDAPGEPATPPR